VSDQPVLTDAQRRAAVTRKDENIALRSGAGCGKTLVLARRFTELLLDSQGDENPLLRFVAVTFTDKAAMEMRRRVRKYLRDRASQASGQDRRRLLDWLSELPEARISTIHSFCASLLRTYAVEVGLDPNFSVCADELLIEHMRRDAAETALLQAVEADDHAAAQLVAEVPFDQLVKLIDKLLELRADCDLHEYRQADVILARWRKLFERSRLEAWRRLDTDEGLRRQVEQLASHECTNPNDRLLPIRDEAVALARRILDEPSARTVETFCSLRAIKPGGKGSAKAWPGIDLRQLRQQIKDLQAALGQYAVFAEPFGDLDEQAAQRLAGLVGLAMQADAIYGKQKRAQGLLDFDDLLLHTRRLLRDRPDLRERLGRNIGQLLIDECQDTSAAQVEIFTSILFGPGGVEQAEPGRLFVVGDPKQSIYRFRGAQVEVFEQLCEQLGPSRWERLDTSFRTHESGVAFINHLFAPLIGPSYEPIRARPRPAAPGPSVEILLARETGGSPIQKAQAATRAQASVVAQRIEKMLQDGERIVWDPDAHEYRPVRPGDIAILFCRMTQSLEYERQLARRRIPYYVIAGSGFYQQQEVFDLLNALSAVENPYDDIAFVGTLRSSMFGLDDEALMHLAEACEPPYLPTLHEMLGRDRGIAGLTEAQSRILQDAVDLLVRLGGQKDALGIDGLIERLLSHTGYEAALMAQFQGRRLVGNIRRVRQFARQAEAGGLTLAEFIEQMSRRVTDESRYEQAAVAGEDQDVVRLMTIHKAKGLEFPVVFIPDLNAGRRKPTGRLIHRLDWGLAYKHAPNESNQDDTQDGRNETARDDEASAISYRLARCAEDADDLAEDIRKLYVAATRHRDHLVLVGADWRTKDGRFSYGEDCLLNRIDVVLDIRGALDKGRETIPYAGGFAATLRPVPARQPRTKQRTKTRGERLLAKARTPEQFAAAVSSVGGKGALPELLGPLPVDTGRVQVAATALADFEHCPMLYRWRHELRVRADGHRMRAQGPVEQSDLDAATFGTLVHRCMELLDLDEPQPAEVLLQQAACDLDLLEQLDPAAVAPVLEAMVRRFSEHELFDRLRDARQVYRELDFVLDAGPATIRGQIDLLYSDADGRWNVVDYKSDNVSADELAEHARRYRRQLLLYCAAVARQFGRAPAAAVVYFLRPAEMYCFDPTDQAICETTRQAGRLVEQMIASSRSGKFERRGKPPCPRCPYGSLCVKLD